MRIVKCNFTIIKSLSIVNHLSLVLSRNQTDYDTHLPLFLLAYGSSERKVTGLIPTEMPFCRTMRLPCDIFFAQDIPVKRLPRPMNTWKICHGWKAYMPLSEKELNWTTRSESEVTTELGRILHYCQETERCCLQSVESHPH
ncbi:hypothetical protein AVEN_222461-1 [Araneus ventricosus]|uniref:Uncharacterized protein n=1 Tax=Araneus ventricosus TaxID=182803 RepID=A0A4Y2VK82_ARAVE|nr:hypothetical protein AVEN_222461-1 [Araneus ventricosus]